MRAELISLAKPIADTVARHLVAAGQLIQEDVDEALAHAMAARRLASRIAAVREAVGLAAYAAGEWQTAIAEIRTYHRMTGRQNHLAVLADCERALGRPEKAIDLFRTAEREKLAREDAIELLIVTAGARGDLDQFDAAVAMLQVRELTSGDDEWAARLRYAYADALLAADRREEAREWFARAADVDEDSVTDAAERLLELDGVQLEDDDFEDEGDDQFEDEDGDQFEDGERAEGDDDLDGGFDADEDGRDPAQDESGDEPADYSDGAVSDEANEDEADAELAAVEGEDADIQPPAPARPTYTGEDVDDPSAPRTGSEHA